MGIRTVIAVGHPDEYALCIQQPSEDGIDR